MPDASTSGNSNPIARARTVLGINYQISRAMFSAGMKENHQNEIVLYDVSQAAFKHLLQFIYTGFVPVRSEKLKY